MTYGTPLWLDNGSSYPAGVDRQLIAAAFPQSGVIARGDLAVSQRAAGADSSVDVADGRAVIYEQGTTVRAYLVRLFAGPQNVPLPASPASNSRYDMIYAQVRDSTIAGVDNDWLLTVVSGAAAVSPVEPAAPSGQSLLLARVLRTAGTATVLNAAIADRRVYATPKPVQVNESTTITPISSTSFVAGSPVCGTTFVAPPSGQVMVTVSGAGVAQSNNGFETQLSWELREGATIGAGAIHTAASAFRAVTAGRAVVSGGASIDSGSNRYLAGTGVALVAGAIYNVRTMHAVTGGGGTIDYRALLVEPVL